MKKIDLNPEKLGKVCFFIRKKNEKTLEYIVADAIREYRRLEGEFYEGSSSIRSDAPAL